MNIIHILGKNECALDEYDCPENSVCVDTENGYRCNCRKGYQQVFINGKMQCQSKLLLYFMKNKTLQASLNVVFVCNWHKSGQ